MNGRNLGEAIFQQFLLCATAAGMNAVSCRDIHSHLTEKCGDNPVCDMFIVAYGRGW